MDDEELQDQSDAEEYPDSGKIGCFRCDQGWVHGCCDSICRSCNAAFHCDNAQPCVCNPHEEIPT